MSGSLGRRAQFEKARVVMGEFQWGDKANGLLNLPLQALTGPTGPRGAHLRPINRTATIRCHPRFALEGQTKRGARRNETDRRLSMRACVRVALISVSVPASFGLAGCAAIDELRDTILRWVESGQVAERTRHVCRRYAGRDPCGPTRKTCEKGSKQDSKETGQIGARPPTAAERCASPKETTDPRFPREGTAGRN